MEVSKLLFDFKESLSDEPIFENLFSKDLEKILGKSRDINEDILNYSDTEKKFLDAILSTKINIK